MYLISEMHLTDKSNLNIESYYITPTKFGGVDLFCYSPDYADGIVCTLYNLETHEKAVMPLGDIDLTDVVACKHDDNIYTITQYEYKLYCWLDKGTPLLTTDKLGIRERYKYSDFDGVDFRFMNTSAMHWRFEKGYPCHTVMRLIRNCITSDKQEVDLDVDSMKLHVFLDKLYDCRHFYGKFLPKLCNCIEFNLSCSKEEFNRFVTKLKVLG